MISSENLTENQVVWNSQDLELLPDNGNIYEIIDGDLYMTRAPRWEHQNAIVSLCSALYQ